MNSDHKSKSELALIHQEIETIYHASVDHIHCDMIHRFVDEQQERIERLEKAVQQEVDYQEGNYGEVADHLREVMPIRLESQDWEDGQPVQPSIEQISIAFAKYVVGHRDDMWTEYDQQALDYVMNPGNKGEDQSSSQ